MLDLLLLVFGLIALFKGEIKITANRRVSGCIGRVLGVLMLAGAVASFLAGRTGWIAALGTVVLAIAIGLATSEEIKE
jgi:hypothetical protein